MCEWYIFSRVYIFVVLSVCISDEPSVCCVCGYICLRFVACLFVYLFVTKVTNQYDWSEYGW